MDAKGEGAVLPQVPLDARRAEGLRLRGRSLRDGAPTYCAMCGTRMLASHGHGLCPSCGFMAAPEERARG